MTETEQMRETLRAKGTSPLVRLFLNSPSYFNENFVIKCIDELELKCRLYESGTSEFSELEKLAIHVLRDSAYLTKKESTNE